MFRRNIWKRWTVRSLLIWLVALVALAIVLSDHLRVSAAWAQQGTRFSGGAVVALPPNNSRTPNGCAITAAQTQAEHDMVDRLNGHRIAVGVAPLVPDPALADVARAHACDMAQHQQASHIGSDGSSPFQRITTAGISYHTAGENIGMAGGSDLIGGVTSIDDWMMAEPLACCNHHWNILNPAHTQIGIGIIALGDAAWLTEDFIG